MSKNQIPLIPSDLESFSKPSQIAVVTTLFEFPACICSEEIGMVFTTVIQNHQRVFARKAYLKFRKILILPAIQRRKKVGAK